MRDLEQIRTRLSRHLDWSPPAMGYENPYTDHAALVAVVRRCRVMPMNGAVWIAAEDWGRVVEAVGQ